MNGKDLYRAVGQIEDDLILAANEEPVKKTQAPIKLWALAAAACLCLVCLGGYWRLFGTTIVWNQGSDVSISKFAIPEGSVPRELTLAEAEDYYRIGTFPDTLGDELRRTGPDTVCIYTDVAGTPVYDGAQLWYEGPNGAAVWISLARVSAPRIPAGRLSRIGGIPAVLAESEELPGYPTYSARWERGGTFVCATGNGLDKTEFIALVEEFLARGR